ncbi:MAG: carbamoyltransferase HypF, partial [Pyramidobacter sp.]|nr:carbamoyltransferase HypF [Pyramidobacter sp.]
CGHLKEFRLPGGDRAVMEPWRCGLSLLVESSGAHEALELCQGLWPGRTAAARQLLNAWEAFPLTSSCGRLFDGLAAIVLKKETVSYDGEAAMELQAFAETHPALGTGLPFDVENSVIDWRPFVAALARPPHNVLFAAGAFHTRLAQALAQCAANVAGQTGIRLVALSGGCWQNGLLLKETLPLLRARGLTPLTHKLLSPNDECLSVGQAYIGGLRRNES